MDRPVRVTVGETAADILYGDRGARSAPTPEPVGNVTTTSNVLAYSLAAAGIVAVLLIFRR